MLNLHRAEFVLSAAAPPQFVRDGRPQFAFAGRSNVGKSSVINRLLNRRNFARVGDTPGKTVHVNYFLIDEAVYFVDLPGYGYARVSHGEKRRWAALMESFFAEAPLTMGLIVVDMRHTPTEGDKTMTRYFQQVCAPFAVIANKADKTKPSQREARLEDIRAALVLDPAVGLIPFSARTGWGRDEVLALIEKTREATP
ncbi:MAG: ribosome biogenesis GTP-binding protein YihA/YsxC [Oscillospiraceae bacterium]|jgi:GTP-binding protein|nr:ribosome biogenesis GTP-binding protein YihA/YsxC [Oscillospiraceae bacterium]